MKYLQKSVFIILLSLGGTIFQYLYAQPALSECPNRNDIDVDNDGLIELCDLESLNAIRYQLDGSGYKESASAEKITIGCAVGGCRGYELTRSLDFSTATSYHSTSNKALWTTGEGWLPLGKSEDTSMHFEGVFEGNGYTISNLYINRSTSSDIGLFYRLSAPAEIRNVALSNVNVTGNYHVGGLLGQNFGKLSNSYVATGTVTGASGVGGLVGLNYQGRIISSFANVSTRGGGNSTNGLFFIGSGGLVGNNFGSIINSRAAGDVSGEGALGGLAGQNFASIINSYAQGNVSGMQSNNVGGLVGDNYADASIINSYAIGNVTGMKSYIGGLSGGNRGSIINSYATGDASGGNSGLRVGSLVGDNRGPITNSYAIGKASGIQVGGLVGRSDGTITASYWNKTVNSEITSADGIAASTTELQSPIAAGTTQTDVYYGWSGDSWDFGTISTYPALRYATADNLNACDTNITTSSTVLPCGISLPDQSGLNQGLAGVFFFADGKEVLVSTTPILSALMFDYRIQVLASGQSLRLRPYAINDDAEIEIIKQADPVDYFSGKSSSELSHPIPLSDEITLAIVVTDDNINTTYTFVIEKLEPIKILTATISPLGIMNEGTTATLTMVATGGTGAYDYECKIDGQLLAQSTLSSFECGIPADIVDVQNTTQTVALQIIVRDKNDKIPPVEYTQGLTVRKVNNDDSRVDIEYATDPSWLRIIPGSVVDADGTGSFSYQWQAQVPGGEWMDISDATTPTYSLPVDADKSTLYRVAVLHTDGQGYATQYLLGPFSITIDGDGDGLIDIYTLEDLDAIRGQIRNMPTACATGNQSCRGFELRTSLDFADPNSYRSGVVNTAWTTGAGWQPIGSVDDFNFSRVFEGNEHTISNLYINRPDSNNLGLFYALGTSARVRNIWLSNANVTGESRAGSLASWNRGIIINSHVHYGTTVTADRDVGGLVGYNQSRISSSFANATVMGNSDAGGLVGSNFRGSVIDSYATGNVTAEQRGGGLVGKNDGRIINSYAMGNVTGTNKDIGGLVGWNNASIINSYATGDIEGIGTVGFNLGGLVGFDRNGSIINSYATGNVKGVGRTTRYVGGLVGRAINTNIKNTYAEGTVMEATVASGLVGLLSGSITNSYAIGKVSGAGMSGLAIGSGTITASYWNKTVNSDIAGGNGIALSTVELQSPIASGTAQTDVYYSWSEDSWDFGTTSTYPALRYAKGGGLNACDTNITPSSTVLPCGILLPGQSGRDQGLAGLFFFADGKEVLVSSTPILSSLMFSYRIQIIASGQSLRLRPYAVNDGAKIKITKQVDPADYFIRKSSGEVSHPIPLLDETTLAVVVTDDDITTYTFVIEEVEPIKILTATISPLGIMNEGTTATLTIVATGGTGAYDYECNLDGRPVSQSTTPSFECDIPADTVSVQNTTQTVALQIIVRDKNDKIPPVEYTQGLTVRKVNNDDSRVDIESATDPFQLRIIPGVVVDADGTGSFSYQWQWQILGEEWTDISGATTATYELPTVIDGRHYRVVVIHTDGQGYTTQYLLGPFMTIDNDGDGLIDIYALEDLNAIRRQIDNMPTACGTGNQPCQGFELRTSLDFADPNSYRSRVVSSAWTTGEGWQPIGSISNPFSRVFEGNKHTISNLHINRFSSNDVGLFSALSNSGEIRNIRLSDGNITARNNVGSLVGSNRGRIIDSGVSHGLTVVAMEWVGGLVGQNYQQGRIISSFANATVRAESDAGGLVGSNDGEIVHSYAMGNVTALNRGGGLVSFNDGEIIHSYATGDVVGNNNIGGLVGGSGGLIINSYAIGDIEGVGEEDNIGGLVGETYGGSIINSYASGNVSGEKGGNIGGLIGSSSRATKIRNTYAEGMVMGENDVGGLVGQNFSSIINSYALGAVMGENNVGGLVGQNPGSITNSYAIGKVSGTNIGGLVGRNRGLVAASYWDNTVNSEITHSIGISTSSTALQSPTAAGTTQTEVYYGWSEAHWDFGSVSTYPALRYAEVDDLNTCRSDITTSSTVLPCGLLLPDQNGRNHGLAGVFFFSNDREVLLSATPRLSSSIFSYRVRVIALERSVKLRPYAINDDGAIKIIKPAEAENYFVGKSSSELSKPIPLSEETTVMIVVTDNDINTTYTFVIEEVTPIKVLETTVKPSGVIKEGDTVTLTVVAAGGTAAYHYEYRTDRQLLLQSTAPSFEYRIPINIVAAKNTTATVEFQITIGDENDKIPRLEYTHELTIQKANNGDSHVDINFATDPSWLRVIPGAAADADGAGSFSYQWQAQLPRQEWADIRDATTPTYSLPKDSDQNTLYRAVVTYTDGQGYPTKYLLGPFRTTIDIDGDGLIDIHTIEDLNAVRYKLDGSGHRVHIGAITSTQGCLTIRCRGYELMNSLDFADLNSYRRAAVETRWTTATGWAPIGSIGELYSAVFEGNGHTISNLYINRPAAAHVGLFAGLSNAAEVRNVGLFNVNVQANFLVGGLVATNRGKIINSYVATGRVTGRGNAVGGLVSHNKSNGEIISSFTNVNVMSSIRIGGLVGLNEGSIINSYAMGAVKGTGISMDHIGGLVGEHGGLITNSYATAKVIGNGNSIGGLVGNIAANNARITASYWDLQESGRTRSAGGTSRTSVALKSPTAPAANAQ